MGLEEYLWLIGPYVAALFFAIAVLVWAGVRFDRNQQRKAVEGIKDEVGSIKD